MTRRVYVLIGLAALALAAAVRERAPLRHPVEGFELRYFPSGEMLQAAALGFDALVADYAFLHAVQYYGRHRRTDHAYPWAHHLFDVVTELDPKFSTAYAFGGMVIAQDMGRLDLALELLERGMRERPDDWTLPFEAGFLTMVTRRDHQAAGRWFKQACSFPDAPDYVHRFAAYAKQQAGSIEEALELWRDAERAETDPGLREAIRRNIEELETELATRRAERGI